jgi:hypothetical protein
MLPEHVQGAVDFLTHIIIACGTHPRTYLLREVLFRLEVRSCVGSFHEVPQIGLKRIPRQEAESFLSGVGVK